MNALEKVFAIILAAIIMFIVPVSYFQIKKDSIIQINVETETARFAERVAVQGYVTKEMYEKFIENLGETGKLYTVELERCLAAYEPEYRFRTPDEVTEEDENLWTGTNELHQGEVSTSIPEINDLISTKPLNAETNESVLAAAVDTPVSSEHIHTDACYNGTKHIHSGNSTSGGGCYGNDTPHTHTSDCYFITYCTGTWSGGYYTSYQAYLICSYCGYDSHSWSGYSSWYSTIPSPIHWTCQSCGKLNTTSYSVYSVGSEWHGGCSKCSASISSSSNMQGVTHGTITTLNCNKTGEYKMNCDKTEGYYYNGDTEVFPVCSQQVVGITATHPVQYIAVNDPLITTVVVTHADGSTTTKACTTSFSTVNVGQNQAAELTYSYMVDGVPYTKTCTIMVNIIPRSKTCPHGHTYNLNNNGTDPGCPYCKGWLSSLTVYSPSNGLLRMYHNSGTLITEGVTLRAIYMDGHSELIYNGYADNLDPDYIGLQSVTIGYKGLTTILPVEVFRNKKQCDVCGLLYNLYPDDTDPGCPYCKAKVPIFTGNVMRYDAAAYKEEVVTELYEGSKTYYFRKGDTFTVRVVSRNRAVLTSFLGKFWDLKINAYSTYVVKEDP